MVLHQFDSCRCITFLKLIESRFCRLPWSKTHSDSASDPSSLRFFLSHTTWHCLVTDQLLRLDLTTPIPINPLRSKTGSESSTARFSRSHALPTAPVIDLYHTHFYLFCLYFTCLLLAMASFPNPSTLLSWAIYFVPVYIFVLNPLLSQFFPDSTTPLTWESYDAYEGDDAAPGLNLTDDSFISPNDGVPANCPGAADGYQVHLLSRTPLIIYIENFLSDAEADHLVDIR